MLAVVVLFMFYLFLTGIMLEHLCLNDSTDRNDFDSEKSFYFYSVMNRRTYVVSLFLSRFTLLLLSLYASWEIFSHLNSFFVIVKYSSIVLFGFCIFCLLNFILSFCNYKQ